MQVDVLREVQVIGKDDCPKYAGWIAQTPNARIAEEQVLLEERMRYEIALLECNARAAKSAVREKKAVAELDNTNFLSRWGLPIGILSGAAFTSIIWGLMMGFAK